MKSANLLAKGPAFVLLLLSCLLGALAACADTEGAATDPEGNNAPLPTNNASVPGPENPETPAGNNSEGGTDVPDPPVDPLLPPQCIPSEEVCDGLDNDCDGEVDEVACVCTDEDTVCYGGPAQTRGVGACRDGARECGATGEFFDVCLEWIGPETEICLDRIDNDCDGIVDEGACIEVCQPGEERSCYGGDEELAGVGLCGEGTQVCGDDFGWLPCEEWVPPEPIETCDDGIDNDCDGIVDVDCYEDLPNEDAEDSFEVSEVTQRQPVDFIMAVDNSGSMRDTVAQVEANLGDFAGRLVNSGIDYHFVLIAERGTSRNEPDVCIPPPMAGSNCSDSARFIHLNHEVDSHSAYNDIVSCYSGCSRGYSYRDFLRPDSLKQVIVVSDDEARLSWGDFESQMLGTVGEFVLNGVVGLSRGGCVANRGSRYIEGAEATEGELLHICDNDWGRVIDVLFESTVTLLETTFDLSRAPIPETIRVFLHSPGLPEIELVDNWSYNEATNAILFPETSRPANGEVVIVRYKVE